jgi:hypothetical protein
MTSDWIKALKTVQKNTNLSYGEAMKILSTLGREQESKDWLRLAEEVKQESKTGGGNPFKEIKKTIDFIKKLKPKNRKSLETPLTEEEIDSLILASPEEKAQMKRKLRQKKKRQKGKRKK